MTTFDEIRAAAEAESSPERQAEAEHAAEVFDMAGLLVAQECIGIIEEVEMEESDHDTRAVLAEVITKIKERFGMS